MNMITKILLVVFVFLFTSFDMSQKQKLKPIKGSDLKTRWEAALQDGRSNHPGSLFWVGYSFNVRHGVGIEITPEPGIENQNLGLFFLYDPAANSVKTFDVYNMDREHDYDYPAYWLGQAENNESLDFLKAIVVAKAGDSMSVRLIEAISMHESQRADAVLGEMTRQLPGKRERTMATYWLKERATARQPFEDLPDNVPALTEILRNDRESLTVRRRAAVALGMCADPAGLRALATYYPTAGDREVRELILGGAVNKVNETSVALFLEVAASETDRQLKQQAYDWLTEKTGKRIAWDLDPGIKIFPNDGISSEESANLEEIRRRTPDEAAALLITVAETHQKIGVRKAAVVQLGQVGGQRALEFFRKVLSKDAKGIPVYAGTRSL
jgi:hypothetical protein